MWYFLKRSANVRSNRVGASRHSAALATKDGAYKEIVTSMGDFGDLANENVALKFWLPEPVEHALEDLAGYYEVSVSLMVRMLLADYVYGRIALAYMRENQVGIHRRDPDPPMFSRSPSSGEVRYIYKVPELGKNIAPIKVWIAQRLKDDLQLLADHADTLLSKFVREIMVGGVFGRGTLPERPVLHSIQSTHTADAWEQGAEAPMQEVDFAEIGELIDYVIEKA